MFDTKSVTHAIITTRPSKEVAVKENNYAAVQLFSQGTGENCMTLIYSKGPDGSMFFRVPTVGGLSAYNLPKEEMDILVLRANGALEKVKKFFTVPAFGSTYAVNKDSVTKVEESAAA